MCITHERDIYYFSTLRSLIILSPSNEIITIGMRTRSIINLVPTVKCRYSLHPLGYFRSFLLSITQRHKLRVLSLSVASQTETCSPSCSLARDDLHRIAFRNVTTNMELPDDDKGPPGLKEPGCQGHCCERMILPPGRNYQTT